MDPTNNHIPPVAKQIPHTHQLHGDVREDPYYWLNKREDQAVLDYLAAENEYTEKMLEPVKGLQEDLFEELKGRIKEKDSTVPYLSNGYYYYRRFEEGLEYPIFCRKRSSTDADEKIILDVNELAKGFEFFNVGGRSVSENNKLLAFGEDRVGRRIYTLRILDLETGKYLPDTIPNTSGSVAWADDNITFFYTLRDINTLRTYKVMRHRLGTPVSEDEVVFEEMDDTFYTGIYRERSDEFLFIFSSSTLTSEFQYLKTSQPDQKAQMIQPRIRKVEYDVEHLNGKFYIRTNEGGDINFKLVSTPVENPGIENWEEVISHRSDVLLEEMICLKGHLVLQERINGISELRILPWNDLNKGRYIEFNEEAHGVWFGANEESDTTTLRFIYTSMATPPSTFDIDLRTGQRKLLREMPVLGQFNKEDYKTERIWVKARDGKKIPVSMVYHKDFVRNGEHPCLLYAYGSYGNSTDPYFSSNRLSLLNRGFSFAIAHVRGGEELGRQWYDDGKLLKKKNTFTDFIDCGEYLIDQNYTTKDHLFAMGGSAGGLLMGAIVNMRPDLWRGVVAAVPFVDVVTTMLDESIPLTTFEYDEWGNPNDKEFYDYIKSYSPYDNIEACEYPNLLVTTGLHDSQVQYWEPAKWVARLRAMKQDNNLLLLKTNMDAGHGGASGRFKQFKEIAVDYAFLLYLSGITN